MFVERMIRSLLFLAALVLGALGWGLVLTNAAGTSDLAIGIFLLVLGVAIGGVVILAPSRRRHLLTDTVSRRTSGRLDRSAQRSAPARRASVLRSADANAAATEQELFERWQADLAELGSRLDIVLMNKKLWVERAEVLPAGSIAHRTRLYVDGQLTALGRVIFGDNRDISLDGLLEEIERSHRVITFDRVLDTAIENSSNPIEVSRLRQHFESHWDDGSGSLDEKIVERDRRDLADLLNRLREWTDSLARRLDPEFELERLSFVDLDYAVGHTTEIFRKYQQLLGGSVPTTPIAAETPRPTPPSATPSVSSSPLVAPVAPPTIETPPVRLETPGAAPSREDEAFAGASPSAPLETARAAASPRHLRIDRELEDANLETALSTPTPRAVDPADRRPTPPVAPRPVRPIEVVIGQLDKSTGLPSAEAAFFELGPIAEEFLRVAASRGVVTTFADFIELSTLIAAYGPGAVVTALERAIEYRRFLPSDVRSILRAGPAMSYSTRSLDVILSGLPEVPERQLSEYRTGDLT